MKKPWALKCGQGMVRGSSKKQAKEDRFPWSGDIQRPLNLTTRGVWKRLRKAEVRQENSEAAA